MKNELIKKDDGYRGILGCGFLFKIFAKIGKAFYLLSEKCVWYSKERAKKIALDESYEKRLGIGTLVLENEKYCDENIPYEEVDISCEETVEEMGKTYLELQNELTHCRDVVYYLWESYRDGDMKKMEETFESLGLKTKNGEKI